MSFDKLDTLMFFIETEGNFDLWVKYKGRKLLVRMSEVQ